MPWLTESETCPVCGRSHDFLTEGKPDPTRRYAFVCPRESEDGVVTLTELAVEVPGPTRDSVPARMVW